MNLPRNPFRRREPIPKPDPAVPAALADLDRLARSSPELAEAARTLALALPLVFPADARALIANADESARAVAIDVAARSGSTIFALRPPTLDADRFRSHLGRIVAAIATEPAWAFQTELQAGRIALGDWLKWGLGSDFQPIIASATTLGLDPEFALSALRLCLLAPLATLSTEACRQRPQMTWERGSCPTCGGPPCLAESRGIDGQRFLRCGRCADEWASPRLRCPECRRVDPGGMTHWTAEGREGRRRLVECDACGAALLVVSTLGPLSPPGLLVAELEAIPLRLRLALDRGVPVSPS